MTSAKLIKAVKKIEAERQVRRLLSSIFLDSNISFNKPDPVKLDPPAMLNIYLAGLDGSNTLVYFAIKITKPKRSIPPLVWRKGWAIEG